MKRGREMSDVISRFRNHIDRNLVKYPKIGLDKGKELAIEIDGKKLHRIVALNDFNVVPVNTDDYMVGSYVYVPKGTVGGYTDLSARYLNEHHVWISRGSILKGFENVSDTYIDDNCTVVNIAKRESTEEKHSSIINSSIYSSRIHADSCYIKNSSIARVHIGDEVFSYTEKDVTICIINSNIDNSCLACHIDDKTVIDIRDAKKIYGSQFENTVNVRGIDSLFNCNLSNVRMIQYSGELKFKHLAIHNGDINLPQKTFSISNIGSRNDTLSVYAVFDPYPLCVYVSTGCWTSTLDEFIERVDMVYGTKGINKYNPEYYEQYMAAIYFIQRMISIKEKNL